MNDEVTNILMLDRPEAAQTECANSGKESEADMASHNISEVDSVSTADFSNVIEEATIEGETNGNTDTLTDNPVITGGFSATDVDAQAMESVGPGSEQADTSTTDTTACDEEQLELSEELQISDSGDANKAISDKNGEIPTTSATTNNPAQSPNDIRTEKEFSYSGFQVVHGAFFAHLFEPSVTFKDDKVAVNAACIRKLPTVEFVQFLVHPEKKLLAVKPCLEDDRDSFRWCSNGGGKPSKRKPKAITCHVFYAKVMKLMGWNSNYRYKILGKLICSPKDKVFVFDLTASEAYKRRQKDEQNPDNRPRYSESWQDQFGVPVEEHDDSYQLGIFDDSVVFRIDRDEEAGKSGNEQQNSL